MITVHINLFTYDELAEGAKKKTLEDMRYANVEDCFWYDSIYEDFTAICKTIGVAVDDIYFSGFYSQGDGSKFNAAIDLLDFIKCVETQAWKSYAPELELDFEPFSKNDRILKRIQDSIIDATVKVRSALMGYYVTTQTDFNYSYNQCKNYDNIDSYLNRLEQWIKKCVDTLNDYLFKSLRKTYEENITDEAVAETILINGWLFTEDGEQANRLYEMAGVE